MNILDKLKALSSKRKKRRYIKLKAEKALRLLARDFDCYKAILRSSYHWTYKSEDPVVLVQKMYDAGYEHVELFIIRKTILENLTLLSSNKLLKDGVDAKLASVLIDRVFLKSGE